MCVKLRAPSVLREVSHPGVHSERGRRGILLGEVRQGGREGGRREEVRKEGGSEEGGRDDGWWRGGGKRES